MTEQEYITIMDNALKRKNTFGKESQHTTLSFQSFTDERGGWNHFGRMVISGSKW